MKRTWTIFTLIFAGLTAFSGLQANNLPTCTSNTIMVTQAMKVTESEWYILKDVAPSFNITHQELINLFEQGNATIESLGNNQYRVTAYVNSGNPIEAIGEGSF